MTNTILTIRLQPAATSRIAQLRSGRCVLSAILSLAALFSIPSHAESTTLASRVEHSRLEIVTTALGLERLTEYSANKNALGIAWSKHVGTEAAYFNVGESKFTKRQSAAGDNVGGRGNLKLAVDFSTPLTEHARFFSRVGMYWWEVDVNYNRTTNELDASREGNSRTLGVGAIYGTDSLRVGIELEHINADSFGAARDQQRVLFNAVSKF